MAFLFVFAGVKSALVPCECCAKILANPSSCKISYKHKPCNNYLHKLCSSPVTLHYSYFTFFPVDYRLVVVGELACLSDLESFTVGGIPPVGPTLAGRSKGRGQTKC